ncbi:hypothetical protein ACS0TY_032212 [Phlomoides rotata]
MSDQTGGATAESMAAPPLPHRRPRVREVSSRFMSPLVQSNSTPAPNPCDFPRSKSVHRRQPSKSEESIFPDSIRSSVDSSKSSAAHLSTVQRKHHQERVKQHNKENGEPKDHQHSKVRVSSRPDTPIAIGTDRIVQSRYRQVPNSIYRSNSVNSSSNGCSAVTAAARLLQEATSDVEKRLSRISTSSVDDSDSCSTASNQGSSSCPTSPHCVAVTRPRTAATDVRTSMPDVDKWLSERNFENSSKDCARSLNFASMVRMGGGVSRPPHPSSCMRAGLEMRKGKKTANQLEEVHSLKMLSNHYLQWRLANAKTEATTNAQKHEAERKLYSLGGKMQELRENVRRKHEELAALRRLKTLTTIVEAQMPNLDEWSILEEDYSNSLSGATDALLNSSFRVPVSGDVRADVGQIGEALNSAYKVVEMIGSHLQSFFPKAEEMDTSVSELARMVGGEKALVEECGDLLSKTYSSQVYNSFSIVEPDTISP